MSIASRRRVGDGRVDNELSDDRRASAGPAIDGLAGDGRAAVGPEVNRARVEPGAKMEEYLLAQQLPGQHLLGKQPMSQQLPVDGVT